MVTDQNRSEKHFIFASADVPGILASSSIDTLLNTTSEIFAVTLASDGELEVLMNLLGIKLPPSIPLPTNSDFSLLFDYSEKFLPALTAESFDHFYDEWLGSTGRAGNMDEYGQLLFLQGYARDWNTKASRFILKEC